MTKRFAIFIGLFALLLHGVNVRDTHAIEKIVKTKTINTAYKSENLFLNADNVVILFDTSSSMGSPYGDSGMTKLQASKKLLQQRAELFPEVFSELNVGLYSYTQPGFKGYKVFYKMQPFNKKAFLKAVDQLPDEASGPTLLQNALNRLDNLLERLSGHTVVFLFTDGSYSKSKNMKKPVVIARQLAKKHDVSFQIISTTDMKTQKKIMEAVASINESSRVYSFGTFLDHPELYGGAIFVLEESYFVSIMKRKKVVGFKLDHILFDYNKTDIKIEFTEELNTVGEILNNNPDSYIFLIGFTDSQGPKEYNLGLSRRRAEAIDDYLAQKFQIDESRVFLMWYGESDPVDSNDTEEGRRKNRRVMGYIGGVD